MGIIATIQVLKTSGCLLSEIFNLYSCVWFVSGLPIPIVAVSVGVRYDDYGKGDV